MRPSRAMAAAESGPAPRCVLASSTLEGARIKRRFEATHARRRYAGCLRRDLALLALSGWRGKNSWTE